MHAAPALPRARALLRILASALLVLAAGALVVAPASAHVSLTGTVPAADSEVATAPTQVELTYSAALLAVGNAVAVTGPSGLLTLEPPQVSDRALVQPLPADLPPGQYTVQWRAASGDGHPIEGTFSFTSTAAAPSSSTAAPTSSTAEPPATSTSSTSSATSSSTSAVAAPGDPTDPGDSSNLALWVGVPVALLGAAGIAAVALRRGRRPGEHE